MRVGTLVPPVVTENSVRSENKEVPINREIMVAPTDELSFRRLFALAASSFRTVRPCRWEILALRHQLAVFQKKFAASRAVAAQIASNRAYHSNGASTTLLYKPFQSNFRPSQERDKWRVPL